MRRAVGKLTLGVVLVVLGLALASDIYGGTSEMRELLLKWWPLAIVLLGLEYIAVSRNPEVSACLSGGAVFLIILAIGAGVFYGTGSRWSRYIQISDYGNWGITARQGHTYEIEINEAFGTGVTELDVRAIGDVIVNGAPVDSVTGTATITVRGRTVAEAERYAEDIKVVPRYSGKTLYLEVVRPDSVPREVSYAPSFVLTVPESADLDIETVSGRIDISGVTGRLDLNNVSGSVEVDGSPSRVRANVVSGGFDGSLGPQMEEMSVNSVSGSVRIKVPDGTGGSVHAISVSGSIDGNVPVKQSPGRSEASGNIGNGSTDIDVETVSGSITFD